MAIRISQRDIAREAGCSQVTVSLAMRHHFSIPEATRRKVQEAADRLGYQPDAELAALMARCRQKKAVSYQSALAWISAWPDDSDRKGYGYWAGAVPRARELGYRLEGFNLKSPGMTPRRLSQILKARNIRGLILAPQPRGRGHINLDWENHATVALGYSTSPSRFHVVSNSQFRSAVLAMRQLRRLGYRRIGFVQPMIGVERTDHNYLGGFLVQQRRFKRSEWVEPFLVPAVSPAREEALFAQWLERYRPDAILHDGASVELYVPRLGLRVPRDIGLASLNYHPAHFPGSSGIDQNQPLIGAKAVDLLVGLVQYGEVGIPLAPVRLLVEGTWCEGMSVRSVVGEEAEAKGRAKAGKARPRVQAQV